MTSPHPVASTLAPQDAFRLTRLPHSLGLFRAFLFLHRHADALPAGVETARCVELTRMLNAQGVTDPDTLAMAMLIFMPQPLFGAMESEISPTCALHAAALLRHRATRHVYLDQAPQNVQIVSLFMLTNMMQRLNQDGNDHLRQIESFEKTNPGQLISHPVPLPQAPIPFFYTYQKTKDKTGNTAVEDAFLAAAYDYIAFYHEYLDRLEKVTCLGAQNKQSLSLHRNAEVIADDFDRTLLRAGPLAQAAYTHIAGDGRVDHKTFSRAVTVGEMLSTCDIAISDEEIAAGMILAALPYLSPLDITFLPAVIGGEATRLLQTQLAEADHGIPGHQRTMLRSLIALAVTKLVEIEADLKNIYRVLTDDTAAFTADEKTAYIDAALLQAELLSRDTLGSFLSHRQHLGASTLLDRLLIQMDAIGAAGKNLESLLTPGLPAPPPAAPKLPTL